MVNVKTRVTRYLQKWNFNGKKSDWVEANVGDKIIVKLKDEVLTGDLIEIGTKNVSIKAYPTLRGNSRYIYRTHKIAIKDIERWAVYPKFTQHVGHIYCNREDQCI